MILASDTLAPDAGFTAGARTMTLAGSVLEVLESCAYRWFFDRERSRFRRLPRTAALDGFSDAPWRDYSSLEFSNDGNSFVVALDPHGTRLLSATGHGEGCTCTKL
ncbi:MAG: hypothetical protein KY454_02760 [Actinobacteria bacterium]|nr:hypothetical protein [Actinomycetota bacterium]